MLGACPLQKKFNTENTENTEIAESTEKAHGLNPPAGQNLMIEFLGVIFVPVGDFYDDVGGAVGDGLAAEAGFGRDAGSFVEFVEFGVGGFVAGFEAFPHDDVARRAGADAAAGMIEAGLDAFGNVEDAAREAVVAVGNFLRVDFDGLAAGKKCHFEFLRGGFVFDFLDVWVAAAHFVSPSDSRGADIAPSRAQHAAPLERKLKLRPVCGLLALMKPPNSLTLPRGARWHDSVRRCACESVYSRCRRRIPAMQRRSRQF